MGLERTISDEAQAFYYDDQASRDAWGVSFFCGTSAVIRRAALESIGGFPEECDTEDIFTSIILLASGWRTICLPEPLSIGVAPANLTALIKQRTRWCHGNLRMLFLKRGPLRVCPYFSDGVLFTTLGHREPRPGLLLDRDSSGLVFHQPLSPVPPLDALLLPITFFVMICAAGRFDHSETRC